MSEFYGATNFPERLGGEPAKRKPVCYHVPDDLAALFTDRGVCDLIEGFMAEDGREIKTISAYPVHSDRPGFAAFFHPSMKEGDEAPFLAKLEELKDKMLERFPTAVLKAELKRRAGDAAV